MNRLLARWFGSGAAQRPATARLSVEPLGERIVPSVSLATVFTTKIDFRGGVLLVTPPADQASPHSINMQQQVVQISLPDGELISGHGLKTAEAHTPVVDWTPT